MATDVFGDDSLFSEFEKERETQRFLDNTDVEQVSCKSRGQENDASSIENDGGSESDGNEIETESGENEMFNVNGTNQEINTEATKMTQHKILFERNKFHSFAKIIDSTRYVPKEQSPALQILFQNNQFARNHRAEIEAFVMHLIERDSQQELMMGRGNLPKLNLKATTPTCVDINEKLPTSKRTAEMWEAHAIIGSAQFHNLFMVDPRGWPLLPGTSDHSVTWDFIKFEQLFQVPLPLDEDYLKIVKMDQKKRNACFNCEGEHNLNDCPLPKDQNRIRENRRKFQDAAASSVPKLSLSKNYSDFEDSRFKKFQPGKISDELQEAMGIDRRQLPPYIYKMRVMGYPPGWLLAAKKGYSSGIVIFDKDGKETNLKGETLEDGEINGDAGGEEVEPDKIVEYPGFTMPVPEGVVDECYSYNMPALQPHQLKETLLKQVVIKDNLKKRKAEYEEELERKRICLINKEADMEMSDEEDETEISGTESDFRPPLPVNTPPAKPPLPDGTPPITPSTRPPVYHPTIANLTPPRFDENNPPLPNETPPGRPPLPDSTPPPTPTILITRARSQESSGNESPSVENLQAQYEKILAQLNEDDSSQNEDAASHVDSDVNSVIVVEASEESDSSTVTLSRQTTRTLSRASSNQSLLSLDEQGISRGNSITKVFGTPIIEASSSVTGLPDRSKFKQGAEEHLLFENLPGATGTFSKIRKLMGTIKSKMRKK